MKAYEVIVYEDDAKSRVLATHHVASINSSAARKEGCRLSGKLGWPKQRVFVRQLPDESEEAKAVLD